MNDKIINIQIKNGKVEYLTIEEILPYVDDESETIPCTGPVNSNVTSIAIKAIIDYQKKELNKLQDEANKSKNLNISVSGNLICKGLQFTPHKDFPTPKEGMIVFAEPIYKRLLRVMNSDGKLGTIEIEWD